MSSFHSPIWPARTLFWAGLVLALVPTRGLAGEPVQVAGAKSAYKLMHSFNGEVDGAYPQSGLLVGGEGKIHGVVELGGGYPYSGTSFRMTAGGRTRVLTRFYYFTGEVPSGGQTLGLDGNYYGTTIFGGRYFGGTLYRMSPNGDSTVLHHFHKDGIDCAYPQARPTLASDGNFYGTTREGGSHGLYGCVYRMHPDGELTVLHSFNADGIDGVAPTGALLQARDGNFYGTTVGGGSQGLGTVFRMNVGGSLKVLHSFQDDGHDGARPGAALVEGHDGQFFGVTAGGGAHDLGTVFRVDHKGNVTILHEFSPDGMDGQFPRGDLLLGRDGHFYGTTQAGGEFGDGTVYRISAGGSLHVLHSFNRAADGGAHQPEAGLVELGDGEFYGTTHYGGDHGAGTIYRVRLK